MSKNLTRKGLALGALVALGSSVIAGPAYAIDPVSLEPTTGTTYTTILGETFNLNSQFTDAAQNGTESLKFLITDSSEKLGSHTVDATTKKLVVTSGSTAGADNGLALSAKTTATAGFSVTVQAWLDFRANGILDSDEVASAVRTVNFVTVANSGLTTTLSPIVVNDAKATATIKFGADVNVAQLNKANYSIAFGVLAANGDVSSVNNASNWAANSTDSGDTTDVDDATTPTALVAKDKVITTVSTPAIYVAQAVRKNSAGVKVAVGDPSYYTVSKVVATTVDAPAATVGDNIRKSGINYEVRSGTKSVALSAKVTKTNDAADAQVAAAGIVATVTVSVDTIDSDDTISVGGISFAGAKGSKTFTATSDADGKFNFTVASLSGKVGTSLYVSIKVAGLGSTNTINYKWVDATIAAGGLLDTIVGKIGTTEAVRQVVKGGSVSIKYALKDDFGKLVDSDKYRVSVSAPGVSGTGSTTATAQVVFSGGYATATFTDGSAAAGDVTVTATAQVWDATAGNWVNTLAASLLPSNSRTASSTVKVVTAARAVSAITVAKGANVSLDSKDFVTGDSNVSTVVAPSYSTSGTDLSGDVVDQFGAGIAGQEVTVSAAGIQFVSDGVYAVGSITVVTGPTGTYQVNAYSHTAGKVVFTLTTGSVSKTITVTYNSASATSGTTLVVTAPAAAVPGKSLTVSAKLTDKWGNPVDTTTNIAFSATGGLGYFVGTLPTETDADGVASATFVTQPSDAGTVKFTVKYENGDADVTTSANTVVAAAVVVDPSASVATVTVTPAATTSQAGRALDVTVKAVDASGAAVAGAVVALSSTGAGSLSATSVVTDAAGTATVKLVAGASDLGSATVKAVSNTKSGSAVVEFGATDASVDLIGKRVYVTTEFAAGKRVTIYDNGVRRYSAIQTSDAEKVVMWNVKAGSHTIVVKISGASSDSVTFLVK